MILVGSGPQDGPTWHQNRIQHRSKFSPKGHREQDAIWVEIWNPLGAIFGRFWRQVGPKLGPSWHQNLENLSLKTMSKKLQKKLTARLFKKSRPRGEGSLLVPFGSCFPSFPSPQGTCFPSPQETCLPNPRTSLAP